MSLCVCVHTYEHIFLNVCLRLCELKADVFASKLLTCREVIISSLCSCAESVFCSIIHQISPLFPINHKMKIPFIFAVPSSGHHPAGRLTHSAQLSFIKLANIQLLKSFRCHFVKHRRKPWWDYRLASFSSLVLLQKEDEEQLAICIQLRLVFIR